MDCLIVGFDRVLRTLAGVAVSLRPIPGSNLVDTIDASAQGHVTSLMRVNHSGEVCAQALYQGQALFARDPRIANALQESADEETEHLAWTAARVSELGGRTSLLDPFWYAGAFAIGAGAALVGDRWSLGFLRETERQVVEHLSGHLERLPIEDVRTRAIVEQMRLDEEAHASLAGELGASELPALVRQMMRSASKLMTEVAYRI